MTRRSLIMKLRPDAAPDVIGYALAFSPGRPHARHRRARRPVRAPLGRRDGKAVRELEQNVGGAHTLEFSPDGRILAVSGTESRLRRSSDVATGAQSARGSRPAADSAMVDVSPDGRRLLQTHGNGEGAVWDIDPESWARRACTLANRTLTREEWEEFLPGRPYEPACRAEPRL